MKKNKRTFKKRECIYNTLNKVTEMQREIYEYERFMGNLILSLCRDKPIETIQFDIDNANNACQLLDRMLKELKELREFKENTEAKEVTENTPKVFCKGEIVKYSDANMGDDLFIVRGARPLETSRIIIRSLTDNTVHNVLSALLVQHDGDAEAYIKERKIRLESN